MAPDSVCSIVQRVVASPASTLGWEGLMVSARILAVSDCKTARPMLKRHELILREARAGKPEALSAIVN
jgi:hypothetical protein